MYRRYVYMYMYTLHVTYIYMHVTCTCTVLDTEFTCTYTFYDNLLVHFETILYKQNYTFLKQQLKQGKYKFYNRNVDCMLHGFS